MDYMTKCNGNCYVCLSLGLLPYEKVVDNFDAQYEVCVIMLPARPHQISISYFLSF